MSFDLTLTGRSPALLELPEPVIHSGWLKSRTYNRHNGEWSALSTAYFSVESEPDHGDDSNWERVPMQATTF